MHPSQTLSARLLKGDLAIIFYMSMFKLMLHLAINLAGGYGLFRDELYYVACAGNLAAGYVDQPPFSVYVLAAVTSIFGDSLFAIRLIPAIAAGLTVFFTGLIARRLGGRDLAVFMACLFSMSPINLAMFGFYSMNSLEILTWTIAAYVILLIIQTCKARYWWILGIVLGIGLLNKIGVLFLGAGIFIGLLATPERKWLKTREPYLAGAIAFALFLPYVIWNLQHDLAHLEFIHNASGQKYSSLSMMDFLQGQLLINNPVGILIWFPGLIALFVNDHLKTYRWLAFLYVAPLLILLINGTSKSEYLAPAYPMLWAAGSAWWEQIIREKTILRYALVLITTVWLLLAGMTVPMVLPVLPVETYIAYAKTLGFQPDSSEGKELAELPQFYADMFGWKEKAEGVAKVFQSLPAHEKQVCAIFSNNYGRCASIDYYGKRYGLPKTIGNHNNYWIWGTRGATGEVVIILGGDAEDHLKAFDEVTQVSVIDCNYCMPYENHVPVFVCRRLKVDLQTIWASEKHYE